MHLYTWLIAPLGGCHVIFLKVVFWCAFNQLTGQVIYSHPLNWYSQTGVFSFLFLIKSSALALSANIKVSPDLLLVFHQNRMFTRNSKESEGWVGNPLTTENAFCTRIWKNKSPPKLLRGDGRDCMHLLQSSTCFPAFTKKHVTRVASFWVSNPLLNSEETSTNTT